jgi:hypothetical protein
MGSVVAKSISMNGGTNFHYDEALGNLNGGGGYRTSQWKELQTAAERSPLHRLLNSEVERVDPTRSSFLPPARGFPTTAPVTGPGAAAS